MSLSTDNYQYNHCAVKMRREMDVHLLRDNEILQYLLKNDELINKSFYVPQCESPSHFILRKANELYLNGVGESSIKVKSYFMPSLFATLKTNCLTCEKKLVIKKTIESLLYDDVLGSSKVSIISKYCSGANFHGNMASR